MNLVERKTQENKKHKSKTGLHPKFLEWFRAGEKMKFFNQEKPLFYICWPPCILSGQRSY